MAQASSHVFVRTILSIVLTLGTIVGISDASAQSADKAPVIEVVTLTLKPDVTPAAFGAVDQSLQSDYVSKQPGFIARESAPGEGNTWLVIVHWRSVEDASASMQKFESAAGAAKFMSMIMPDSMVMKRYSR